MHNRTAERKINRLRLGHTNLKAHLTHKTIIENPIPMCKCELAHETPLHVLFHCKLYDTQRKSLINSIELMYVQKQVPYYLRTIDRAEYLVFSRLVRQPKSQFSDPSHIYYYCFGANYLTQWLVPNQFLLVPGLGLAKWSALIDVDILVGFNNQHSLEVRYHIAGAISTFLCSITTSISLGKTG